MPGTRGLGYDLSYLDDQGQHFVEVKTSAVAGNRQFFVSRAEVTFGEQHPDTYEVLLITGIHEAEGPRYKSLGNPFVYGTGQDFMHTTRFTVEHDTFRVRFEVVGSADKTKGSPACRYGIEHQPGDCGNLLLECAISPGVEYDWGFRSIETRPIGCWSCGHRFSNDLLAITRGYRLAL